MGGGGSGNEESFSRLAWSLFNPFKKANRMSHREECSSLQQSSNTVDSK